MSKNYFDSIRDAICSIGLSKGEFQAWLDQLAPGKLERFKAQIEEISSRALTEPRQSSRRVTSSDRANRPLKILYVSGMFPSTKHAGGLRLFDILERLSDEHEVSLFSVFEPGLDQESFDVIGPKFRHLKLIKESELTAASFFSWLAQEKIDLAKFDVVQFEYPMGVGWLHEVSKVHPNVGFTYMENVTRSFGMAIKKSLVDGQPLSEGAIDFFLNAVAGELNALLNAHFIIALTDADASFGQRVHEREIGVVPTGISDQALVSPELSTTVIDGSITHERSAAFLGFYGHPPNKEGLDWYFGNVHEHLLKLVPDARIRVLGMGDLEDLKAKYQHFAKSIDWVGPVDHVGTALIESAICIAPLISGAGFRGKVNQYLCCYRPVIGTSVALDGLPYSNADVIRADDPREFAKGMATLMTDKAVWRRYRDNGRTVAMTHFHWDSILPKLIEIYDRAR